MIPIGGIALWSGALIDVPAGWQLCDGTNGTPDLRGKFLKGAGPADPVDGEGGALKHTHGFDAGSHNHSPGGEESVAGAGPDGAWDITEDSGSSDVTGTTSNEGHQPPFYTLAYIQRML